MDRKNNKTPLPRLYTSQLADSSYKREFTELLQKLINDYYRVNDLSHQQQIFGSSIHAALPLAPSQNSPPRVVHHLLGDIEGTELFAEFEQWVNGLVSASSDQEKRLGAIVQVSGYGKTHLARAYTSTHRAVYLLFTNELAATYNTQDSWADKRQVVAFLDERFAIFHRTESALKDIDLEDECVIEKEFARVLRVSEMCRRIVRLFLLAAVEYYTDFIEIATPLMTLHPNLAGSTLDHPDLLKLGSLLFNNTCLHFFLNKKLHLLYSQYHNDVWWDSYVHYVLQRKLEYKVCAIFCDEVHGLLDRHVGLAFHENVHHAISKYNPSELKELFDSCDADKDGYLLKEEFCRLCSLVGMPDNPSEYWQNDAALQRYPAMSFGQYLRLFPSRYSAREPVIQYNAKLEVLLRRKYEAANKPVTSTAQAIFAAKYCDVINLYQQRTSLTYLITKSLEFLTKDFSLPSICVTTDYSVTRYYEPNTSAVRSGLLFSVFDFNRDPNQLFDQYSKLIKRHFGHDLSTILSDSSLRDAFSARPLYMTYLFGAVTQKGATSKALEAAKRKCKDRAKSYVKALESTASKLYHRLVLSVVLHNCVLANSLDPRTELDQGSFPVMQQLSSDKELFVKDYFMITSIRDQVTANNDLLANAILASVDDQPDLAIRFNETLMSYIALKHHGKSLRSICHKSQLFYRQGPRDAVSSSFVYNSVIQAASCATIDELIIDVPSLLKDPLKHLKDRLVVVKDNNAPDGLSLTLSGTDLIVTAWQSKFWNSTLTASDLIAAASCLNPAQFFGKTSNAPTACLNQTTENEQQLWLSKYIRIFIAREFDSSAIQVVNTWNLDPEHVNHPIVLVQFEDHLVTDVEKELLAMKIVKEDIQRTRHSINNRQDEDVHGKARQAFTIMFAPDSTAIPTQVSQRVTRSVKRKHECMNESNTSADTESTKRRKTTLNSKC